MILRFNEEFAAFIDAQYPKKLSKTLKIKASDLMNIYTLHRKKMDEPNFFQMEIKDFNVASFFTGFSFKRYVGLPDHAITVIFSPEEMNNDNLPKDFEGMLRKIAYELLPLKYDPDFNKILKEYYIILKNGDLEPYWEESIEEHSDEDIGDIVKELEPIKEKDKEKKELELKTEIITQSEDNFLEDRFDKLEKEVLEQEIEDYKMLLKEKSEKIRELTKRITGQHSGSSEIEDWKLKYEKLEEEKEFLNQNLNKLTTITSQQNQEINTLKKELNEKKTQIEEMNREIEENNKIFDESKKFEGESIDLQKRIETLKRKKDKLSEKVDRLTRDNDLHIDSIASLKIKMKEIKNKLSSEESVQNNLSETIIDLKKDIKILRRERDNYKKLAKKK